MASEERAIVYYGAKEAGELVKKPDGYAFTYNAAYLSDPESMPISLSMPLAQTKYESPTLFPFFDGLLPEGWLLELTCKAAKIDKGEWPKERTLQMFLEWFDVARESVVTDLESGPIKHEKV